MSKCDRCGTWLSTFTNMDYHHQSMKCNRIFWNKRRVVIEDLSHPWSKELQREKMRDVKQEFDDAIEVLLKPEELRKLAYDLHCKHLESIKTEFKLRRAIHNLDDELDEMEAQMTRLVRHKRKKKMKNTTDIHGD